MLVLLAFPATLTPRQRAVLHAIAELNNLSHQSHGEGEGQARHIRLGHASGQLVLLPAASDGAPPSDRELCVLLGEHLQLHEAQASFDKPVPASAKGPVAKSGAQKANRHANMSACSFSQAGGRPQGPVDIESWVADTLALVEMERQAEVDQAQEAATLCSPETAQARGRALLNLRVSDTEGGLLGRTLITLVSNKGYSGTGPGPELPPHKFGGHDMVALRPSKGDNSGPPLCSGVVYRVKDTAIVIAVEEAPEEGMDQPLRLEKLANEVTYQRLKATLTTLARTASGAVGANGEAPPGASLVDVGFGRRAPRFASAAAGAVATAADVEECQVAEENEAVSSDCPQGIPGLLKPFNHGLDHSQQTAVGRALLAKDFALIHGPPGTGKTTALLELILQEVARGSRVLAAAASNIAVDNIVERLVRASPKLRVVRMGHPARLLPQVLDASLEAHVLRSDSSALARDCRKEIKAINQQIAKLGPRDRAERRTLRGDLRRLATEERRRQGAAVAEVIKGAAVIASTLTGLLHPRLAHEKFDIVVIDEAAQALEVATWAGLLRAPRAVLAGDHLQLPPVVISDAAAAKGLGRTLFERLHALHGETCATMLTVQYRMNKEIMQWASDELYQGRLTAHESVADHTLGGMPLVVPKPEKPAGKAVKGAKQPAVLPQTTTSGVGLTGVPVLLLIDTAGCGFEERKEEEGDSLSNEGEAKAVMAHALRLIQAGLPPSELGIITPYNAQVALLRGMRTHALQAVEISSVDGFQGREKEAILISTVRSNTAGGVGFLADCRRMNVAITRARRHCALITDSETVGRDPFLRRLLDYFESHAEYASAEEYVQPEAQ